MAAITLSVKPLPLLTVTGNTHICIGQTTTISVSGAASYSWSTGATTNSIVVSPSTNTNYLVAGTGTNGCMKDTLIKVNVSPVPTVQIAGNTVVCSGDSVLLTASGAHDYSWTSNGALTPTVYVLPLTTTVYTVIGFVSNVCSNTGTFAVQVNPSPTLLVTASIPSICPGQSLMLNVSGAAGYTWSTGSNSTSIGVAPLQTTTYSVSGTNTVYCTSSKTLQVTVLDCSSISTVSQSNISLHPMPVKDLLYFNLTNTDCNWSIYSAQGQCVLFGTSRNGCIQVTDIPSGIYVLLIQSGKVQWRKTWIKE